MSGGATNPLGRGDRTLPASVERAMSRLDKLPLDQREAQEARLADALDRGFGGFVGDHPGEFRSIRSLPALRPEAPELPVELVPMGLRAWVEDAAELMQVPPELIAVPAVVAAGAVVGRKATIQPKARDTWTVTPNLWGAVVALPSRLKTPALTMALGLVRRLEENAREEQEQIERDRRVELVKARQQEKAIHELLKQTYKKKPKNGPTPDELGESLKSVRERLQRLEDELTPRRYVLNDVTVEKAVELLRSNPNGLLQERDELTGWLRSLDRNDRKGDREFYLETWVGDRSYTSDRIGRGTIHAPNLCLSIIGGMQPGKLAKYVSDAIRGQWGADGLLQRFQLLVWPEDSSEWKRVDREPDLAAKAEALKVFKFLDGLEIEQAPRHFDSEAQQLFNSWWAALETRLREPELRASEAFMSHLGKYRSLMPSLALIFHLCSRGAGESQVPTEAARLAAAWCDYLEHHARKVYAVELRPGLESAHALAAKIRSRIVEDGTPLRDIYRKEWSALKSADQVDEALRVLSEHGWLWIEPGESGPQGGRPSPVLRVNPEAYKP